MNYIPKLLESVRNGELRVSDFNLGGPNDKERLRISRNHISKSKVGTITIA